MFTERNMPVTVYGVASAMARNPQAVAAMNEAGWEIASHGLKWIDYRDHTLAAERTDLDEAVRIHTAVAGMGLVLEVTEGDAFSPRPTDGAAAVRHRAVPSSRVQ
jgi:peptidoglycan/xylan/chitin deacetylase (PgdA/CDA1 family)